MKRLRVRLLIVVVAPCYINRPRGSSQSDSTHSLWLNVSYMIKHTWDDKQMMKKSDEKQETQSYEIANNSPYFEPTGEGLIFFPSASFIHI